MWRMSTGWCRSTSSPVCRRRSRNWRKFSCIEALRKRREVVGGRGVSYLDRHRTTIQAAKDETVSGKKTMKALVLRKHGGLDELAVVSDHPLPAGVAGWKVGERVLVNPLNKTKGLMGEMLDGGMAEYCLVAADQLVAMPAGVTFEEAASLPVAYGTAHRMLITHDTIRKGERVVVLGASGGVGTGCVILAKHLGAEVIACAGSADKMRRLKELGADEVINYQEVDF